MNFQIEGKKNFRIVSTNDAFEAKKNGAFMFQNIVLKVCDFLGE